MNERTIPAVPFEPPPGFAWRMRPAPGWSTDPAVVVGRRCRYTVPAGEPGVFRSHGIPAVAVLYRRHGSAGPNPWGYCADHLYGRWISPGVEDVVLEWVLRKIGDPT